MLRYLKEKGITSHSKINDKIIEKSQVKVCHYVSVRNYAHCNVVFHISSNPLE